MNKLSNASSFNYQYCEACLGYVPNMWTSSPEELFYTMSAEPDWKWHWLR